jgi:prevent-host-death family protein
MDRIGSFEAKTHWSALLARAAKGAEITITKHGLPVAKLVPAASTRKRDSKELGREVRALRKGNSLAGLTIRELISEGRRY